jgi:hypothetical protein
LRAFSRYAATPRNWVIEWTADGDDYRALGASAEPAYEQGWPVLQGLLQNAAGPLTRAELVRAWPESAAAPARQTVWKWLHRALREGLVRQQGRGTRNDPLQYSLPERSESGQANSTEAFLRELARDAGLPPR